MSDSTTADALQSRGPTRLYRVLLVDDDPLLLKLGLLQLTAAGYQVETASSAADAIEMMRKTFVDAVVCDVLMGDVDGFGFCRRLRSEAALPRVPVILISAHYDGKAAEKLAETVGASEFVLRTPDFSQEMSAVARALEQQEATRRGPASERVPRLVRRAEGSSPQAVGYEEHLRLNANQLLDSVGRTERAESRYRTVFENASDTITLLTLEGIVVEANRRCLDVFHVAPEEMIGKHIGDFSAAGHEQMNLAQYQSDIKNGGRQQPVLLRRPDGSTIYMEFSTTIVEVDGERLVCCIGHDVTERILSAQRLETAERRYRSIVERMPDAVWTADEGGTITYVSPNFARIAGTGDSSSCDLAAVAKTILPADVEPLQKAFKALLRDGKAFDVDYRRPRVDGTSIWLRNRAVSTYVRDGIRYVDGVLSDVSEQHRLEEQLLHSQKMDAVGRLAGGVAHDFNNMLNVILGYAWLLLETAPTGSPMREPLLEIKRAAERSADLTRQLLTFSRQLPQVAQIVDVNRAVDNLHTLARRILGEDIDIETHLCGGQCGVQMDPVHFDQIVMNLLANAREAMPNGGRLTIETHIVAPVETEPGDGGRDAASAAPAALLTIRDTGLGMDTQTRLRIFEPFFTTKESGTGLGLSIVFGIVHGCGGHISVDSEPLKGTTFKIRFPLVLKQVTPSTPPAEPSTKPISAAPERARRGGETILLVDDEEQIRTLIEGFLRRGGYRVFTAANAIEAIAICDACNGKIDLVLTDVMLPQMNGRELSQKLTAKYPDMRVLYMSGYTDNVKLDLDTPSRVAFFLQKPVAPLVLNRKVREVLDFHTSA